MRNFSAVSSAIGAVCPATIDCVRETYQSGIMSNQHMFMIVIEGQEEDVVRQLREKLDMIENAKPIGYEIASSPQKTCTREASVKFAKLPKLTARQQEILPLMLDGLSNKRIARVLGLSHFTVRNHITCLYGAFKVRSRRELSTILRIDQTGELKAAA